MIQHESLHRMLDIEEKLAFRVYAFLTRDINFGKIWPLAFARDNEVVHA